MTPAEQVYRQLQQMPDSVAAEVLDFVQFLQHKKAESDHPPNRTPRQPGSAKGLIWIAKDFDAPLADFEDYR
jgi:hypothetical protein